MAIDTQNYLQTLYRDTSLRFDEPYLALDEEENIIHATEKPDTKIATLFQTILGKINTIEYNADYPNSYRDDCLAHLEGIEQNVNTYYGNFKAKVNAQTFTRLAKKLSPYPETKEAYRSLKTAIGQLRTRINTPNQDLISSTELVIVPEDGVFDDLPLTPSHPIEVPPPHSDIDNVEEDTKDDTTTKLYIFFHSSRIEKKQLSTDEIVVHGHTALRKAFEYPIWREQHRELLTTILQAIFNATESKQLTHSQIIYFIDPIKNLEDFFGEDVVWKTIPILDRETKKEIGILRVSTLRFLAGPSNNLLVARKLDSIPEQDYTCHSTINYEESLCWILRCCAKALMKWKRD